MVVTVPSATWLWQQGPKKSNHGTHHGHESHDEQKEDGAEEQEGQEENNENSGETDDGQAPDTEDSRQANGEEGGDDVKEKRDDGGEEKEAKGEEDKRPIGETIRNEPPNEISPSENKWSSGDEGLKEGDNDAVQKKSQQVKSVDADADEGKKDEPSANVDKGHEGEQRGTRVTEGDKKRKVSYAMSAVSPCEKQFWSSSNLLAPVQSANYCSLTPLYLSFRNTASIFSLCYAAPSLHYHISLRHMPHPLLVFVLYDLLTYFQAEDPRSNSMHPYMADERKSKKAEGVVDTAKVTGTVDVNRPLR